MRSHLPREPHMMPRTPFLASRWTASTRFLHHPLLPAHCTCCPVFGRSVPCRPNRAACHPSHLQAKALLTFVEAAAEKSLRTTVALTASRGRGKSAALGLSLAAAIAYGYANIFVTSPTPENLRTLFEFVLTGFDALGYKEHTDFTIVESANPELRKAIVRINVFHAHRQVRNEGSDGTGHG